MSILVDFSGVSIAGICASVKEFPSFETSIIRHYVLNMIRSYRSKYYHKYGELIICCDDQNYWRKKYFPYYKAKRSSQKAKSKIDWGELHRNMDIIKAELAEEFPYVVIQVPDCEGDDLIAVLSRSAGPHLIVSNDHDMVQLQRNDVDVYAPSKGKKLARERDMQSFLMEQILRGCDGDGVPNVLSDDDTFVNPDKRQRPLREAKLQELMKDVGSGEEIRRNFSRNQTLVDLGMIPDEIVDQINDTYDKLNAEKTQRRDLTPYFIQHRLANLYDYIDQF
jgi:hypothetical protein